MTTKLSSVFNDDFKSYITYTTNSTATSYSVTVTAAGYYQMCTWASYPWKTVLSATGYSDRTGTLSTAKRGKGYHACITTDKTYTWSRYSGSVRNTSISAKTTKNVSGGGSGTVTLNFELSPITTYTIKYDANGGTGAPGNQTKTHGVNLTLSNTKPTRDSETVDNVTTSYTFKGWALDGSATTAQYQPGGIYSTNASDTLYAVWVDKSAIVGYDIVYNTLGGSEIVSQIKPVNSNITLTTTKPTKSGYTFSKWNTKSDGTGTSYTSGATYSTNADLFLYAIWTPWTHTVQFNANGGSGVPSSFTKTTDIEAILSATEPTRTGHIFKEWNTAADGSGTTYHPGNPYEHVQNGGTVTLYAIWISTDIYLYNNSKCKALLFKEGQECLGFFNDGTVECVEFIEGSTLSANSTAFYISEIKEGE